jgi:aryl-alcohol dehydrogenase-like predicted oxidoreductase
MSIPLRNFGKTGVQISALGLGGHHLGVAKDEKTAIDIVHRALDGGITFYDNAWEYCRGKTESWLGLGLKGRRDKVFSRSSAQQRIVGRRNASWQTNESKFMSRAGLVSSL